METQATSARSKVIQIFEFLEALNDLRNPVIRVLEDQRERLWLDSLPLHPSIERYDPPPPTDEGSATDRPLLRVRRAELTEPPAPPEVLADWLLPGWNDPGQTVSVLKERNERVEYETDTVQFEASVARMKAFESWNSKRDAWAKAELPARHARELFERLYVLKGDLDRESGKLELLVGDGHLLWDHGSGAIRHPVLLQRVTLTLDPEVPAFEIFDAPVASEIYTALFTNLGELDGNGFRKMRDELEGLGIHPLGGAGTSAFLQRLALILGPNGAFTDAPPSSGLPAMPTIARRPVLFVRSRSHGMAEALRGIIEDARGGGEVSPALLRIVGEETPIASCAPTPVDALSALTEPEEILLAKPANLEQVEIAERLDRHGCVLVQGPPGTGKTHTIANLIGHLLSQGKSVLVTSDGTKPLRVLRQQIPESLQPLCVSVLDDAESQRQLQSSVTAIAERLSTSDSTALRREADALASERQRLRRQLRAAQKDLLDARTDEYRDVVFGGEAVDPSKAAREVADGAAKHAWIPHPVVLGAIVPLTEDEALTLYATNQSVSNDDEHQLEQSLPGLDQIVGPVKVRELVEQQGALAAPAKAYDPAFWSPNALQNWDALEAVGRDILLGLQPLGELAPWQLEAITAGAGNEDEAAPWRALVELVHEVHRFATRAAGPLMTHAPMRVGAPGFPHEELVLASEIRAHLEEGGSLGKWATLFRPRWKRFLANWKVASGSVRAAEHVQALELHIQLEQRRNILFDRWARQATPLGLPAIDELGHLPERTCHQIVSRLEHFLSWKREVWEPLERTLAGLGFRWSRLLEMQPPVLGPHGGLLRLHAVATGPLQRHLRARAAVLRNEAIEVRWRAAAEALERHGGASSRADTVRELAHALGARDPARYAAAYGRLAEILGKRAQLEKRKELLARLETVAPVWASAIRNRVGPHAEAQPPGNVAAAWRWRQLNDELDRRGNVRLEDLQTRIETLSERLRATTLQLIDRRAWAERVALSTVKLQQSLVGWLGMTKRIGKGFSKRAPIFRAQANRLMVECREAVPVWVMPLRQAALTFRASTRFDVVIVDEASQCDAMALAGLYLGKQIVVVGDHEQVSPSAVGQQLQGVQQLIDHHLQDVPNGQLYDGRLSIYELAQSAFGGVIVLRDHFRCVPDIIRFSSELAYEGKIRPLRDASSTNLRPSVASYRVENGVSENKKNVMEAQATAALIVAATRNDAYRGKTFGVISMVGDEQAKEIDRILRHRLTPAEYERRSLICGNAAQFQGDERDVMFLSMVDGPQDGPLSLRGIDNTIFKQRFNVAASRARDQMWVIHSLNPGIDLKAGDLRRMLIEHSLAPSSTSQKDERLASQTESPFEREVLLSLRRKGYKVTPQWPVGAFRIDLVVEGKARRLAVECDGDRYHNLDNLPYDMDRQAILERLGWRFVRIRGSAFFRNQEAAMKPVFEQLGAMGIEPWIDEEAPSTAAAEDLKLELVREAEALLGTWREPEETETEVPERERTSRKRPGLRKPRIATR